MWAFLVTEVMFFGGIFMTYIIFRYKYPAAFADASGHLSLPLSATNTVLLLTSSLTIALGVRAAQIGKTKALVGYLAATLLLCLVFLGLKGFEYYEEYEKGLIPGPNFVYEQSESSHAETGAAGGEATEIDPRQAETFFIIYFVMTGFHALHMVIGAVVLAILIGLAWRNWFPPENYAPVEMMGLYWHFVDIVWIFVFPLLYLINRH